MLHCALFFLNSWQSLIWFGVEKIQPERQYLSFFISETHRVVEKRSVEVVSLHGCQDLVLSQSTICAEHLQWDGYSNQAASLQSSINEWGNTETSHLDFYKRKNENLFQYRTLCLPRWSIPIASAMLVGTFLLDGGERGEAALSFPTRWAFSALKCSSQQIVLLFSVRS